MTFDLDIQHCGSSNLGQICRPRSQVKVHG